MAQRGPQSECQWSLRVHKLKWLLHVGIDGLNDWESPAEFLSSMIILLAAMKLGLILRQYSVRVFHSTPVFPKRGLQHSPKSKPSSSSSSGSAREFGIVVKTTRVSVNETHRVLGYKTEGCEFWKCLNLNYIWRGCKKALYERAPHLKIAHNIASMDKAENYPGQHMVESRLTLYCLATVHPSCPPSIYYEYFFPLGQNSKRMKRIRTFCALTIPEKNSPLKSLLWIID